MFVNTQAGAMSMAMPDVCKVPNAPAPPFIPTPFPNMAMSTMATPNQTKMMILAMPAHNLGTTTMMTSGDEAGAMGGMVSNMIKGPARHVKGSTKMMIVGMPATRLTDQTTQNNMNAMGTTIKPAQTKVMAMT
jgi:hypothetical protein